MDEEEEQEMKKKGDKRKTELVNTDANLTPLDRECFIIIYCTTCSPIPKNPVILHASVFCSLGETENPRTGICSSFTNFVKGSTF
jgi:hypothetical protein